MKLFGSVPLYLQVIENSLGKIMCTGTGSYQLLRAEKYFRNFASHLLNSWLKISLKVAMAGVFTPQKLANTANEGFSPP